MYLNMSKFKRFYYRLTRNELLYAKSIGVKIGDGCSVEKATWGSEPYLITIENRVQITHGVKFYTHGGAWVFRMFKPDFDFFGKIHIGEGSYLGNNAMIMPGVTLGKNCIVGAGSVVTKSFPSESVIAGCPARRISSIEDSFEKNKKYNIGTHGVSAEDKKRIILERDIFIHK